MIIKNGMNTSEEFIQYYNKIDKFLIEKGEFSIHDSFSQKVKSINNSTVRRYKDELFSLGELRNAIVHNPKIGNKAIAEPHVSTLHKIKEIYNKLTTPKKIIPIFQFEVLGARKEDYINDILVKMREKSFSQFPVFDESDRIVELINTNTISRWLSNNLDENGTIIIDEIKVKNLIPYIEFINNYKFISRQTSIYEAYDLFVNQIFNKKRNLDVLFITETGSKQEKLLGLITIEDIVPEIKK
jgi:predicted transcriptional regulator